MQITEFKPLREWATDWSPEECKHSKATRQKVKEAPKRFFQEELGLVNELASHYSSQVFIHSRYLRSNLRGMRILFRILGELSCFEFEDIY